jgi:hypothetical protein
VKKLWFFIILLLLSGCATYKFQKGVSGYEDGYIVLRRGFVIPEYTIGENNLAPDLEIAQERFNRRKVMVEQYYKKMGYIESRYKEIFWDPPAMMADFLKGIVTLPSIAISDYKYNHDPTYRNKVIEEEETKEELEEKRIDGLRKQLAEYIKEDLAKEQKVVSKTEEKEKVLAKKAAPPVKKEAVLVESAQPVKEEEVKEELQKEEKPLEQEKPAVLETKPTSQEAPLEEPSKIKEKVVTQEPEKKEAKYILTVKEEKKYAPLAVITAKPIKGYSPLRVHFSASGSRSPYGSIVAYHWDFGDGETSKRKDPINTYWSASYGSRYFTATLTVTDKKGNTASSNVMIEVINK